MRALGVSHRESILRGGCCTGARAGCSPAKKRRFPARAVEDVDNYRHRVLTALPGLVKLDFSPVTRMARDDARQWARNVAGAAARQTSRSDYHSLITLLIWCAVCCIKRLPGAIIGAAAERARQKELAMGL